MGTRRRKPRRRNLDAFTDARGVVHPIRGSAGYQKRRAKETKFTRSHRLPSSVARKYNAARRALER